MSDELLHYGTKRHSGRYPWGSGEDPQRSRDIITTVDELRAKGMSEKEIADHLGMNTSKLRTQIAWANQERKTFYVDAVAKGKEAGMTNQAIADSLNISEASVRNYAKQKDSIKKSQLENTVDVLKDSVDKFDYLDVGVGVERQLGISRNKLLQAKAKMLEEGYVEHEIYVRRLSDPTKYTTVTVLTKEKDLEVVKKNSEKIRPPEGYTEDGGLTYLMPSGPIQSIGSKKVQINYKETGGEDKDGLIEIRRGAKDLDLGNAKYAQVRIAVDGTHYLKGMAIYSDDLPAGVDIRFNTNKSKETPKMDVLKKLKTKEDGTVNEANPFGASILRKKGALNIVNEEGTWDSWKPSLSAQFLSKQPVSLVKDRLTATFNLTKSEFDEISSLTNPLVKRKLLESYIDGLDSKANHLKALGLPRTKGHVLLPFPDMKPTEVYAPNYKNGEKVVLVRYPHGGTFELPELTVNNRQKTAKGVLGNALDAIGIHPSVAQKLSGADFDGDTVYVIPNNQKKIKTSRSLKELANFDPNSYHVDYKTITPERKQKLMGQVSNLITDMTIKGATQSEIARAVRHSMVVIDSEKHQLDHKQSAIDNGISALKKKYQTHTNPITGKQSTGAATIISKKKQIKESVINPVTGKKKTVYKNLYDLVPDVSHLSSGTTVENTYVDYIKKLRSLKNTAQKELLSTPSVKRNPDAAKTYATQVSSLGSKLNTALLNAPRERQAQLLATNTYYKNLDYDMTDDQKKRLKSQSLTAARAKTGASGKKSKITIEPKEWEAIQAGAISNDMLNKILNNADLDAVKQLALPRKSSGLSSAKLAKAKGLLANGYTYAEVAESLGVSASTIRNGIVQ